MNLVNVLTGCTDILPIVKFIRNGIMPIIQIGIPIILIVMGSLDLGKAVMSNDDKEIKGATGKLIKRVISAVVIFFIPWLVNLVIGLVDNAANGTDKIDSGHDQTFWSCWNDAAIK